MATTLPSYTGDATSLVPLSGTQLTDSLINGSKWGTGTAGSGAALTYAFPTTVTAFDTTAGVPGNYGEMDPLELGFSAYLTGYSAFSSGQQQAARTILQAYANVANLSFTEIAADSVNAGTLRFANSAPPGLGETTYGVSWFAQDFAGAGDTWMNSAFSFPEGWAPGTQNFLTLLHETGHAIGLKHPHDPGTASDFGISTPVVLPFTGTDTLTEASTQTMVMAYNDIPGISDLDGLSLQSDFAPTTPMRADIAALQYLYGANVSYNAGDTVYTYHEDSRYNETLWDAGGNDTIVATGTRDAVINLQSGSWSKLGTPITFSTRNADLSVAAVQSQFTDPFTVYIYDTVTIENAVGGAGNDTLTGNAQANQLQGLSGNDTLDGGLGIDTARYSGNAGTYRLTFNGPELEVLDQSGVDGTDKLSNVERLNFLDKKLAVDITDNALETLQFIGVIAPALRDNLSIRGAVLSYFDQGHSMTNACQLALDAGWIPSGKIDLIQAAYKNVVGTTVDPDQATITALAPYVDQLGSAGFLAAVANLSINVDLAGLQQNGMEYI